MTESRILWLALGVFVGYVIWGESRKRQASVGGNMAQVIDVSDSGGFVPQSTNVNPNPGFASSCGGTC